MFDTLKYYHEENYPLFREKVGREKIKCNNCGKEADILKRVVERTIYNAYYAYYCKECYGKEFFHIIP